MSYDWSTGTDFINSPRTVLGSSSIDTPLCGRAHKNVTGNIYKDFNPPRGCLVQLETHLLGLTYVCKPHFRRGNTSLHIITFPASYLCTRDESYRIIQTICSCSVCINLPHSQLLIYEATRIRRKKCVLSTINLHVPKDQV